MELQSGSNQRGPTPCRADAYIAKQQTRCAPHQGGTCARGPEMQRDVVPRNDPHDQIALTLALTLAARTGNLAAPPAALPSPTTTLRLRWFPA
eukprot:2138251-Prymnesium_polylepis.1